MKGVRGSSRVADCFEVVPYEAMIQLIDMSFFPWVGGFGVPLQWTGKCVWQAKTCRRAYREQGTQQPGTPKVRKSIG
eukprot:3685834-Amphidinium_carterae.1